MSNLKASVLHGQFGTTTLPVKVTADGYLITTNGAGQYPEVSTFAGLPDATLHNGEIYAVTTPTGVIWVNRKKAGYYISDGASPTDWRYLGEQKENWNDSTANFFNNVDGTKKLKVDASTQPTGTTGTLAVKTGEVGGSEFCGGTTTGEGLTLKANCIDDLEAHLNQAGNDYHVSSSKEQILDSIVENTSAGFGSRLILKTAGGEWRYALESSGLLQLRNKDNDVIEKYNATATREHYEVTNTRINYNRPYNDLDFQWRKKTAGNFIDYNSGTDVLTLDASQVNIKNAIQLPTNQAKSYSAGQLSYDPTSKTFLADTGYTGVRVNIGQETHTRFYNDTGVTITNGSIINAAGVDATNNVLKGILADSTSPATSSAVIGVATADVLDGEVGIATSFGEVRDFDTSTFTAGGVIYLGTSGNFTQTRPTHPNTILFMGSIVKSHATEGIVQVDIARFRRRSANKSYSFTSTGITSGTYYKAGFYDWATTDANLSQASTTQTYGTVGQTYAAHAGIVPSGAGVVDTGQVGLRVTGIEDNENGTQTAAQTGIITEDITTLTANTYFETSEKFSGQITYELYVVSGTPTTYSLDFNYGYAKYEDFQNRDVTITEFEAVWQGNASDTAFDIALLHHKSDGWTYAATGFTPGNGDVCRKTVDQALAGNVTNGSDGAYKRTSLNTFMDGNGSDGVLIEVTTGQNSTIQTMDLHISGVSEEISS
jgi:hypothetical protein